MVLVSFVGIHNDYHWWSWAVLEIGKKLKQKVTRRTYRQGRK